MDPVVQTTFIFMKMTASYNVLPFFLKSAIVPKANWPEFDTWNCVTKRRGTLFWYITKKMRILCNWVTKGWKSNADCGFWRYVSRTIFSIFTQFGFNVIPFLDITSLYSFCIRHDNTTTVSSQVYICSDPFIRIRIGMNLTIHGIWITRHAFANDVFMWMTPGSHFNIKMSSYLIWYTDKTTFLYWIRPRVIYPLPFPRE